MFYIPDVSPMTVPVSSGRGRPGPCRPCTPCCRTPSWPWPRTGSCRGKTPLSPASP